MQIKKDFDYYHNLHTLVSYALLHLLFQVSQSSRFVPRDKRNEILVKYLKPKLNDKALANIKKDIKLMIQAGRKKESHLELKLYELDEKANKTKLVGAENIYSLLVHLYDEEGIESRLFEEGTNTEPGIIYMLEEHIEHAFDEAVQVAPLSILIQRKNAPYLVNVINQHGCFTAEVKEWNIDTHQAHLLLHPASK